MPISDDEELQTVADEVSYGLREIQEYLGHRNHSAGKVRFPRGYLRTAASTRAKIWYIQDETIKRNVAYAHIQADVFRWLLNRTDISATAKEMVIKEIICLTAAIAETLTRTVALQEKVCGKKKGFNDRCTALRDKGAISSDTCEELKWLWTKRKNEHIFLAEEWEYDHYKMRDCNRAVKALHSLKEEFANWDEWFEDIDF